MMPTRPQTHLILATADHGQREEEVEEALIGVMVAGGPNATRQGRRSVDAMLTETHWNDDEAGRVRLWLTTDLEIPLQWLTFEAADPANLTTVVDALRAALPCRTYADLLAAAHASEPGAVTGLALTRDARVAVDLPLLVSTALADARVERRESAVMAAQLSALPGMATILRAALTRETDAGVLGMIRHALARLESAPR